MSRFRFSTSVYAAQIIATLFASSIAIGSDFTSDPTRPPDGLLDHAKPASNSPNRKLELRAIFFSKGRRIAIISDHRVQEGDRIGDARILEIHPQQVRLLKNDQSITLDLIHQDIKIDQREISPHILPPVVLTVPSYDLNSVPAAINHISDSDQIIRIQDALIEKGNDE